MIEIVVALAVFVAGVVVIYVTTGFWGFVSGLCAGLLTLMLLWAGHNESAPAPPVVAEEVSLVLPPKSSTPDLLVLQPREGEGCIRVTRRGGHPLTLAECIELANESKLRIVRNARGFIEAPRLYLDDVLLYQSENGIWDIDR